MNRHKIAMVTAGEERFPAGTVEAIREFAEIRCRRCETPEELLREFGDCEVFWMFGPNLCLRPEALEKLPTLQALFRSGSGLDALPCDWAKALTFGLPHLFGGERYMPLVVNAVAVAAVAVVTHHYRKSKCTR